MTSSRTPGSEKSFSPLLVYVLLLAFSFILYGNTLQNGHNLDDALIIDDHVKQGFAGIPSILTQRYHTEPGNTYGYRPVGKITCAIEYQFAGDDPMTGHLVNTLLYALTAIVIYHCLRKVFAGSHPLFLVIACVLFMAHPIHTEVVASIKNREAILSLLFGLLATLQFLKFHEARKYRYLVFSALLLILGFLSRQDAAVFLLIISLALWYRSSTMLNFPEGFFNALRHSVSPYTAVALVANCLAILLANYHHYHFAFVLFLAGTISLVIFMARHWPSSNDLKVLNIMAFLLVPVVVFLFIDGFFSIQRGIALLFCILLTISFLNLLAGEKNRDASAINKAPGIIPGKQAIILLSMLSLVIIVVLVYMVPERTFLPVQDKPLYNFENPLLHSPESADRVAMAFFSLWFYLQKLIFPHPLGYYYGYNMFPGISWSNPLIIVSALLHLSLLALAIAGLRRRRMLSFIILFYFAGLSVYLNVLFPNTGIVAERFAFIASLAFSLATTWALFLIFRQDPYSKKISRSVWLKILIPVIVLLLIYSMKTVDRNRDWKDPLTLFAADMDYLSNSVKANMLYADELMKAVRSEHSNNQQKLNDIRLVTSHLNQALTIDPTVSSAWHNLGFVYLNYHGEYQKAITCFNKAAQHPPVHDILWFNTAEAYRLAGAKDSAKHYYHLMLEKNPAHHRSYQALSLLYDEKGDIDSALWYIDQAIRIDPYDRQSLAQKHHLLER